MFSIFPDTLGVPAPIGETMCKRHAICDGQPNCIYVIDGVDCTAEALATVTPIPFIVTNLGTMAIDISEAMPNLTTIDAVKIAVYLDSIGYAKTPF